MVEAADREIDSWPVGEPFTVMPSMQSLTLDVIMRTIFGVYEEDRRAELKRRIRATIDPVSQRYGVVLLVLTGGRFVGRVVRGGPFEMGGYTIPEGVEINPSIASIHRRADRYPNPAEFRPERFLGDDAPDTYTWIPFGGGTRRCLGASFALTEMSVVVKRVLERTELQPADPHPEKGLPRCITMVPKSGVRVIQPREPMPASEPAAAVTA